MPAFILILTMPHISINKTYPKTNLKGKKKSSKHTPSFIIHHSGIILLTQQAFESSHDSEFGITFSWFHQTQHSPSALRKPRADSPLIQVWFQILFTNVPCILLTITLQLANHALSELSGQPNIAIPSSSSQPFVHAGSNLDEIRLKQVRTSFFGQSHHSFVFIGHLNFIFLSGTGIPRQ